MKSFLGLVEYYLKFVPDFSRKAESLTRLIIGRRPVETIVLNTEEWQVFRHLNYDLTNAETLTYFKLEAETVLCTDASLVELDLVLVQKQDDKQRHMLRLESTQKCGVKVMPDRKESTSYRESG